MPIATVGYGKNNFDTHSATLTCFVIAKPFTRTLPSKTFKRQGSTHVFPAGTLASSGRFFQENVEVPEGTLLLVQFSQRYKGSGIRDGAVLVKVRQTGPLIHVGAKLMAHRLSTMGALTQALSVCGDILTPAEARALGYAITKSYENTYFAEDEVAECFNIERLSTGTAKPVIEEITKESGEKVFIEMAPAPRRVIRVRAK